MIWRLVFFLISVILLLYINTRLAIVNAFFGIILISLADVRKLKTKGLLKRLAIGVFGFALLSYGFVKVFPYSIEKFSEVTFAHLDKVGKLDSLENPEASAYNSLVTRLSIWKTSLDVALEHPVIGVGAADGKQAVINKFEATNQQFLAKYKFPVHNQFLDFWIKFGILGLLVVVVYIGLLAYIGFSSRQILSVFFFMLFLTANLVDDFLIRFDGIVFSALWLSIFTKNALDIRRDKAL